MSKVKIPVTLISGVVELDDKCEGVLTFASDRPEAFPGVVTIFKKEWKQMGKPKELYVTIEVE